MTLPTDMAVQIQTNITYVPFGQTMLDISFRHFDGWGVAGLMKYEHKDSANFHFDYSNIDQYILF